jgi:uroporphyrin-III C-methyltransferase
MPKTSKMNDFEQPQVTIVGAGPGDPDLLTLKALRYIKNCDILLYDSLFGDEILELVPGFVEKVFVGKTYGDHQDQTTRQDKINRLFLVNYLAGKKIVRLKTGDPLIFSRGIEEIKFLQTNKIPFEIVPGITSALAGACQLGIPLTERSNSSSIIFTTGHLAKNEMFPLHLYFHFLKQGGCLVLYMGFKILAEICNILGNEGFGEELKVIVASNISLEKQRFIYGHIHNIVPLSKNAETPAILYIGMHVDSLAQII